MNGRNPMTAANLYGELNPEYVRTLAQKALELQGGPPWGRLTGDQQYAAEAGTAWVLCALTELGWTLVPP